jgi:hypothetical protein
VGISLSDVIFIPCDNSGGRDSWQGTFNVGSWYPRTGERCTGVDNVGDGLGYLTSARAKRDALYDRSGVGAASLQARWFLLFSWVDSGSCVLQEDCQPPAEPRGNGVAYFSVYSRQGDFTKSCSGLSGLDAVGFLGRETRCSSSGTVRRLAQVSSHGILVGLDTLSERPSLGQLQGEETQ